MSNASIAFRKVNIVKLYGLAMYNVCCKLTDFAKICISTCKHILAGCKSIGVSLSSFELGSENVYGNFK